MKTSPISQADLLWTEYIHLHTHKKTHQQKKTLHHSRKLVQGTRQTVWVDGGSTQSGQCLWCTSAMNVDHAACRRGSIGMGLSWLLIRSSVKTLLQAFGDWVMVLYLT